MQAGTENIRDDRSLTTSPVLFYQGNAIRHPFTSPAPPYCPSQREHSNGNVHRSLEDWTGGTSWESRRGRGSVMWRVEALALCRGVSSTKAAPYILQSYQARNSI